MNKYLNVIALLMLFSIGIHGQAVELTATDPSLTLQRAIIAVEIEGNSVFTDQDLKNMAKLYTQASGRTDLNKLETDVKSLFALGIFQQVSVNIQDEKHGVRVVFSVVENPKIEAIIIRGNNSIEAENIKTKLSNRQGILLNVKNLEADVATINHFYQTHNYDLSHVNKAIFDQDKRALVIDINEVEIEAIMITGNVMTNDHVILREMRSKPGDIYDSLQLRKDRNRIFALGYFSQVSAPELVPGSDAGKIKLLFRVIEQKVNVLNFGAGFSELEPWFFFVNLGFKNPFKTGEEIDLKSQFSVEKTTYSAQYYHPWVFRSPTKFTGRIWNTLGKEAYANDKIDISRLGFSSQFTYPFSDDLQFSLIYKTEAVKEPSENTAIDYSNNSLGFAAYYSTLQYDLHKYVIGGNTFRFKAEQGGQVLNLLQLGGVQFERYDLGLTHFATLSGPADVLALRLLAGLYRPEDPSKPVLEGDQYVVGSATTVRGFGDKSAVNGSRMLIANLEYRHTFADYLQGVLFVDWGDAFERDTFSLANFKVSKGLGVRVTVSGFTIRFDMGWAEQSGVLHFSLGQLF